MLFILSSLMMLSSMASNVVEERAGYSFEGCKLVNLTLNVTDPVTDLPGVVQARIYKARGRHSPSELRSIILVPPTGGENILDEWYGNYLCTSGFQVVLVQNWSHQLDVKIDMSMHDEGADRSLAALRHVLDYLNPQRSTQVGILGTSVGALSAELVLGFDSRLNAGVLIAGGADQAEIIARSNLNTLVQLREERMKIFGYRTLDEYEQALREHIHINPVDFANYSGKKTVLAFVGTEDLTVPTKNQLELVAAFEAQSIAYQGDHLATIEHTAFWEKSRIAAFFESQLK